MTEPTDLLHRISFSDDDVPAQSELVELYDANGWGAYTMDPERLEAAVRASLRVVVAREPGESGRLVGLARVVGDGLTIVYMQDILVLPGHRRRGIGRELFERAFAPFESVRQKVLITDYEPAQRAFYEAMGFTEVHDLKDGALNAFVKLG